MTVLDPSDVQGVVVDVTTLLGLTSTAVPSVAFTGLCAETRIHGGFEGVVQVRCEPAVARHAAISMGLGEAADDAEVAVRELTNVVAGNLKALLPPTDEPAVLSPPSELTDSGGDAIGGCTVACDAGRIDVRVFQTPRVP